MQDTRTGLLHEIPAEAVGSDPAELRQAMSKIIPIERQGATYYEGQIVELNGGKFRVQKIIKKGLVLHGVPS